MRIRKIPEYPIWHVNFSNRRILALAFLRMQEHYESASSRFRGKIFTLDEFKRWQIKEKRRFSYLNDWRGFNVPSPVVLAVYNGFPEHNLNEISLFRALKKRGILQRKKFYLIGTFGWEPETVAHEIRHGMFYCDRDYRRKITQIVKKYKLETFCKYLLSIGYCRKVLIDEIQAYTLTDFPADAPITAEMRALKDELLSVAKWMPGLI